MARSGSSRHEPTAARTDREASNNLGGQIGVVTDATTVLDLSELGDPKAAAVRAVSLSDLRRVRGLSLGDYVLSGAWLGRVVAVPLDVDVLFDDGAVCRVAHLESQGLKSATNEQAYHIPATNVAF